MNSDERTPITFSVARRWAAGLNLIITLAAVLAIVGMVNYLGMRRFVRFNVTGSSEVELSKRTQHVLASLTNNVKVITYFNSQDELFPRIRALLKEYETASGNKIQVQHVDYLRDTTLAGTIQLQYKLPTSAKELIIFDSGNRQKVVNAGTLSEYDTSDLISGRTNEVKRTHFNGELAFTSAIYTVANQRSPKAYFLIGHSEHSPANTDREEGYSEFGAMLQNENNFECQPLDLVAQKEVPADCSLLIIAGPVQSVPEDQVERIQDYLERGGRLLVLFNYRSLGTRRVTALDNLLKEWGVQVGQNIVVDPDNASSSTGMDPKPVNPGTHTIVNPLGSSRVHLKMPRSLRAEARKSKAMDAATVDELLFTGPNTALLTDFTGRGQYKSTTGVGPQPLAIAVEKSIPGVNRGATRIVAIGDSSMWGNLMIESEANRVFAAATVNWLVAQNLLLSEIPRRSIKSYKLSMTQSEQRTSRWLLLAGMPSAVLFVGLLVWARRRK